MADIIDFSHREPEDFEYLNKAVKVFKIYGIVLFVGIVALNLVLQIQNLQCDPVLLGVSIIGIPILTTSVLAPLGLHYCIKSARRKERNGPEDLSTYYCIHFFS